MKSLCERLSALALAISTLALIAITAIVGWQVWARYGLNASPSWSEAAALLLMLYTVLFGAAWGVRHDLHLGFHWFRQRLPARWQHHCEWLVAVAVLLFALLMMIYGAQMLQQTWRYSLAGLPLSMAWQYLPLVGSGALMALFAVEKLISTPDEH